MTQHPAGASRIDQVRAGLITDSEVPAEETQRRQDKRGAALAKSGRQYDSAERPDSLAE